MGAAQDRQAKLAFIKYVNEARKKIDNEMSVSLGALRTSLTRKSSYDYGDLQGLIKEAERVAKTVSDRSLLTMSKEGVKLFGPGGTVTIDLAPDASEDVVKLKTEIDGLQEKLEAAESTSRRATDLERILEEKESEIIQFQDQIASKSSRVNAMIEEINAKQEIIDDLNRSISSQQEDRKKLEEEIMKIGNTMMDYTAQVERLQAVLSSRDEEIEKLTKELKDRKDQSKELVEHKEAIKKAKERIKALKTDVKQTQKQRDEAIAEASETKEHDVQAITTELREIKDE